MTRYHQPFTTAYACLTNNWLASITHRAPGGAAFQTIAYTYDANGNRITQTDSSGTTTFGYDTLNRLIQAAYPGTYGTWSWTYDPVGNRTAQTAPSGVTTYAYNQNNRLTQAGAVVYSYDANGNLINTSAGQSFTYDPFNRMTQAVGTGGTATYTYNGDGLKVQRNGPDGTTRYYYDGIRPIWETDGAGAMTAQLDRDIFGNLLSRAEPGSVRRYYHPDGLGSTIALTDETGAVAASMFYDAWGQVRVNSGTAQGKYRFAGAELDTASGFYHMGARFHDPSIGRWLSEDPIKGQHYNPRALNFYAYAWSAPTGLIDQSGEMPSPVQLVTGLSVHAAVERWFRATFPGSVTELRIQGVGLRLDMVKPGTSGVWEVYELKPASWLREPVLLVKARSQLNNYVDALRSNGWSAQAGSTWNPQGERVRWNSMFDAVLTSSSGAPGVIGYELSPNNNAISELVNRYGVDVAIAAAVLGILLELAAAGSNSPIFQPE